MTDGDEGPKIEINAPPKSIEISPLGQVQPMAESQQVTEQAPMLTGGIQQVVQESFLDTDPSNVKFVMGPNGQLIAMHKPPFLWKHFLIGGGIPLAMIVVPLIILMIGSSMGYGEYLYKEVPLYKDENSTMYRGEFSLEEDNFMSGCSITSGNPPTYLDIYCDRYDDYQANVTYTDYDTNPNDWNREVVGAWSNDNGTFYFDTGEDYGDVLQLEIEYISETGLHNFFMFFEELMGFTCCLALLLSIVFLIVGFSQNKPGMGWGGVTSLISFPVLAFISLAVLW
mgnify:CR=1 FL=1